MRRASSSAVARRCSPAAEPPSSTSSLTTAGLLVAFAARIGALVVSGWLAGIVLNLLTNDAPRYYDIALRDFGLMLAALTLARLAFALAPARRGTGPA